MSDTDEISVAELKRRRDAGEAFMLLDVREDDELATARVGFETHIPMKQIPEHLAELPRDKPIVVMCHHGGRSERVTSYLRNNGFTNAVNLAGGIDMWSTDIDPAIERY